MGGGYFRLGTIRKVIFVFLFLIALISVVYFKNSQAKYQVGKTYEDIVTGNVKNNIADFNLVSIYIDGEKSLDNKVPEKGYAIDLENTKCSVNGEEVTDLTFKYENGKIGVYNITKANMKCNFYFKKVRQKLNEAILTYAKRGAGTPDYSKTAQRSCDGLTNCETTNGLYETNKNTLNNLATYYFRGYVEDNFVKFGKTALNEDIWWRIIRINEDGTIRLIYLGSTKDNENPTLTGNSTIINNETYCFSTEDCQDADNMYVGYMYTPNDAHGLSTDSYAKTIIDEWYKNNLADEGNVLSGSTGFCGSRHLRFGNGIGTSGTTYGWIADDYANLSLVCPDSAYDLYTTRSDQGQGNGALDYPIGLISVEEIVYAGGKVNTNNLSFYLYNGVSYFSMSPMRFGDPRDGAINWRVTSNGWVHAEFTGVKMGLRPIINLKSDTYVNFDLNNPGTITNPYIVE